MTSDMNSRQPAVGRIVLLLVLLLLLIGGIWQRQNIQDIVKLYGYDPPAPISELADQVKMTAPARKVFYVNRPELQEKNKFNASCSSRGEQSIILGCYHPVDRGIYLFHVTDERLRGVDQVTAAHEMLHAGYDRLSRRERSHINELLQQFYDTQLSDERVRGVVDLYRKTESSDIPNEMHSIFATEVSVLTPELENYYRRYFIDRSAVVRFADTYQSEFSIRQAKVASYDSQLELTKRRIEANNRDLESQESRIESFRRRMDAQQSAGDIEGYNTNVPLYNRQVDSYNNLINATRKLIESYNQLVSARNELALQVTDLAHSIDSTYQPIQ